MKVSHGSRCGPAFVIKTMYMMRLTQHYRYNGRGPAVPPDLAEAYHAGVANLTDAVACHRHDDWDDALLLSAVCAQAVAKGQHKIAEAIMNLDDDLIAKLIELDL